MINKQDLRVLGWEYWKTVDGYDKYLKHFGRETYQLSTNFEQSTVKIRFKHNVRSSKVIFFGEIKDRWDLARIEMESILKPISLETLKNQK